MKELKIGKWIYLLNHIYWKRRTYLLRITKDMDITYTLISSIMTTFTKFGWVNREYDGKKCYVTLTDEGLKMAEHCSYIINELNKKGGLR